MSDLLTTLAAKREEKVQDLHLDLPVPTWDRTMVIRYNVVDRKLVEKFSGMTKRTVEADCDFVIAAVREIYLHDPENLVEDGTRMKEDPNYVRLEDGGTLVRIDSVLAEKLGQSDLTKAREVLMYLVKDN